MVSLTDTIFLGRLGAVALGSAGNAVIFYFIFAFVGTGLSTGMQILIARRNGEKNFAVINELLQSGLFLILIYTLVGFGFMHLGIRFLIPSMFDSQAVVAGTNEYLMYRSPGLLFSLINFAMIAFFVGITQTRVLSWIIPLAALLNILLDYLLIFGSWGFPEMGVKGAAIASVISEALASVLLILIAYKKYKRGAIGLFQSFRLNKLQLINILRLSYPLLAQNFITLSAWFVFFSLIENLGEKELAISHIIRSVYGFLMLPAFSLADASNSLVSNFIGEKRYSEILPLIARVLMVGFVFNVICIAFNLFFEESIMHLFTEDEGIVNSGGKSFVLINFALVFLTAAMILFRSLTGTGRTKLSLSIEVFSVGIYLLYAFGISRLEGANLELLWSSEFIYFGVMGLLSFLFLRFGSWRNQAI